MHEIEIVHTIDAAHRVLGHTAADGGPGKCSRLHGHTYGFTVTIRSPGLMSIGFAVDFGDVKAVLDEWDHRTLLWTEDPLVIGEYASAKWSDDDVIGHLGVVRLPFNPTAENMARHVVETLMSRFPQISYVHAAVKETPKTTARYDARRRDAA